MTTMTNAFIITVLIIIACTEAGTGGVLENRRRGLFGRVPDLGFVGVDKVDKWVADLAWRGEIGLRGGIAMKSNLTEMQAACM